MSSSDENSSSNQNWVLGITLGLLGSILINTGNNVQSLGLKRLSNQDQIRPEETDTVVVKKRTTSLPSLPKWRNSPPRPRNKEPPKRQSLPWLSPVPAKTAPSNNDSNDIEEESEFVVVKVARKTSPVQSITWVIGTIIFVSGSLLNFASYAFAAQSMLASLESIQFVTNLLFGKFMLGAHIVSLILYTCWEVILLFTSLFFFTSISQTTSLFIPILISDSNYDGRDLSCCDRDSHGSAILIKGDT